ncbi:MAG: hypothetical protein L6R40_008589 [Gallowayella cf. fulva]|nr:MAG: hypothetical protein L6R40_008589 [Xanthomendoza cf. fulva]
MAPRAKRRDPSSTVDKTQRRDERSLGTIGEHKTIPNLITKLPFEILMMIYHLVLKEEYGVLPLRLGHRQPSIAYAIGPGIPYAQWHNMGDPSLDEIMKNEIQEYGIPCTDVNLNGMIHRVYNLSGIGFCMASRAIYNSALCYFFSMNLFRCLDFGDLENFLYHVRHVHMIQRIQVAWKDGGTPIAKGIRCLQNRAKGLTELSLIVGKEESRDMLTRPAWRLMCKAALQEGWQVHLLGEAECLPEARRQLMKEDPETTFV